MFSLSDLDPAYEYLPLVAQEEKRKDANGNEEDVIVYRKTYPAFPWRMDGSEHFNDDPRIFIDWCEEAGLVHWETKEQKEERLKREDGIHSS